jgi:hypothetical protein
VTSLSASVHTWCMVCPVQAHFYGGTRQSYAAARNGMSLPHQLGAAGSRSSMPSVTARQDWDGEPGRSRTIDRGAGRDLREACYAGASMGGSSSGGRPERHDRWVAGSVWDGLTEVEHDLMVSAMEAWGICRTRVRVLVLTCRSRSWRPWCCPWWIGAWWRFTVLRHGRDRTGLQGLPTVRRSIVKGFPRSWPIPTRGTIPRTCRGSVRWP